MRLVLIAAAGAAGAISRHLVSVHLRSGGFPWATLGINVVGSFLLGVVLGAAAEDRLGRLAVAGLGIGFLGAFTTFSTFSWEVVTLLREDRSGAAASYVGASIVGGVAAAAAGLLVIRAVLR